MSKWLQLMGLIILQSLTCEAQKELIVAFNFGVNKSIGKDLLKTKTSTGNHIQYYSRQKYKHPYINITGCVLYPITKDFFIGLKSGVYIYFLQEYVTDAQRTTVSIPIQISSMYKFFKLKGNSLGLNLSAGINIFKINDFIEHYGNGQLLSASFFYLIKNKHLLQLGTEEHIDNVKYDIYQLDPSSSIKTFTYKIHRLSIGLSYGFKF